MKYLSTFAITIIISFWADNALAADGELNWGDFGLRVLNFAIFIGLICYFGGKKILGFISNHEKKAVDDLRDAAKMKTDAAEKLEEAEKKLIHIQEECNRLLVEGKEQGEAIKKKLIGEAEKQATKIIEQAKLAAQTEGAQEKARIQAKIADEIVAKLEEDIHKRLDEKEHLKLVEKSLSKVVLS